MSIMSFKCQGCGMKFQPSEMSVVDFELLVPSHDYIDTEENVLLCPGSMRAFAPLYKPIRVSIMLSDDEIELLKKLAARKAPVGDPTGEKRWRGMLSQIAHTMVKRRLRQYERELLVSLPPGVFPKAGR